MIEKWFKKNWQHFAAIGVFLVISCIYFSPALDGYSLNMGDINNYQGMSKELSDFRDIYDEESLWTGTSFSGMPSYQLGARYDNPVKKVYNKVVEFLSFPISAILFAFLSFYILAKSFNAGFYVSLIGSIAYGMATYNFTIMEAGHTSKMMAIAFFPGVIGGMVMLYRNKEWLFPLVVTTFFFILELLVNHPQMTYYFSFIMIVIGLAEGIRYLKNKNLKQFAIRSVLIVFAGFLGLTANFGNYYNTYEFAKKTMRGKPVISISAKEQGEDKRTPDQIAYDEFNQTSGLKRDYITQWSYGKSEAWNLFVSKAKGDSKNITGKMFDKLREENPRMFNEVVTQYQQNQGKMYSGYWGDQPFTSGPTYIGVILIFLAILYIVFVQNAMKWFLLQVTILTLLLAMGKNLVGPGSNTAILFVSMIMLSGLYFVIDYLVKDKKIVNPLKLGVVVIEGLIVFWLINRTGDLPVGIENMWLTNFFIDTVPLYTKFRTVSSILVVVNLTVVLMGVLFLIHLVKNIDWANRKIKFIAIATSAVLVILLVFVIKPDVVGLTSQFEEAKIATMSQSYVTNPTGFNPTDVASQVKELRASFFTADALRGILFIVLTFGFIFLYIKFDKYRKYAFAGIVLLVTIDMWTIGVGYLNNFNLEHTIGQNENVRQVANRYGVSFDELKSGEKDKEVSQLRPGEKVIIPIPNEAWKKSELDNTPYYAQQGDLKIYEIETAKNKAIKEQVQARLNQLASNGEDITKGLSERIMFSELGFNTNYRVLDLDNPFNSARVSYFHKSSGGYNPAKLKRYQDLIDFYISDELQYLNTRDYNKMKVLNMLNNKYYLYQGKLMGINNEANGNAWFVDNIKWVENSNDEILEIANVDLNNTAIVHKEFDNFAKKTEKIDSLASIKMVSYLPNQLSYESNSNIDQIAVFSEIYYENGWKAYIDGNEVPYFRANYALRALSIPSGKHNIEFKFDPYAYRFGNTLNLIGFFIFIILLGLSIYKGIKRNTIFKTESTEIDG